MNIHPSLYYSVYPGEFVPAKNQEDIKSHLNDSPDNDTNLPCLNLKELTDSYTVDVAASGLERDEFIVYGDDNLLFVCSVQDKQIIPGLKDFQRHIVLPVDADAELTVAEYKNSVLHFYVPKNKWPGKHTVTRIVVY